MPNVNGFCNWQTAEIALMADNTEALYREVRALTGQHLDRGEGRGETLAGLAGALERRIGGPVVAQPLEATWPSIRAGLLASILQDVDWQGLALHWIRAVEEDREYQASQRAGGAR